MEHGPQLCAISEALTAGDARSADGHVDRAGDVTQPLHVALEAVVLRRCPSVEQGYLRRAEEAADVRRRQAHPVRRPDRESAGRGRNVRIRYRAALPGPIGEAAVEDPNGLQPVGAETPPRARREQRL